MGLSTVLGLAPRGFFIPYRYAGTLPDQRDEYEALRPYFTAAEAAFAAHLAAIDGFAAELAAISGPPPAPRFDQDWFPTLDAAAVYAMVRTRRPARIVEVGSGHSTRFLARAVADGGLSTRIVAIDPAPRVQLAGLDIDLRRQTLAMTGPAPFWSLGRGDLLLVDSSHVLVPGSDVDDLLNRVLPALPAGLIVHFHDVFLPDDYPAAWGWRGYNEQNALPALVSGGGWRMLFASHYVRTRMAARLAASVVARLPQVAGAYPASLWLEKA
jgi:hypothetical protein